MLRGVADSRESGVDLSVRAALAYGRCSGVVVGGVLEPERLVDHGLARKPDRRDFHARHFVLVVSRVRGDRSRRGQDLLPCLLLVGVLGAATKDVRQFAHAPTVREPSPVR